MIVVAKHDILSGELSSQHTKAVKREDLVAASFNRWRMCIAIQQHDLRMYVLARHVVVYECYKDL
jgi:hypothetical protein